MKKFLFFAFALVVSALVFNACETNNNTPGDPTEVTPEILAGTSWRVDSSYIEGQLDCMPHAVIDVLNTEQVVFNGSDTTHYWIEGDQLYYGDNQADGNVMTIKQYTKDFAILNAKEMQADLYLAIIPKPEGQELEKTVANIVGTWKSQYYFYQYNYYVAATETYEWDRQKHSDPGVMYWTFNADGTFVTENIVFARMEDRKEYAINTGWWALQDGKFAYGYDEKPDQIPEASWDDIATLTSNALYKGQTTISSVDGTIQEYYSYYTRVK